MQATFNNEFSNELFFDQYINLDNNSNSSFETDSQEISTSIDESDQPQLVSQFKLFNDHHDSLFEFSPVQNYLEANEQPLFIDQNSHHPPIQPLQTHRSLPPFIIVRQAERVQQQSKKIKLAVPKLKEKRPSKYNSTAAKMKQERLQKRAQAKKRKHIILLKALTESSSIDTSPETKRQAQVLKNRISAQVSRDNRKVYVANVVAENKQLKLENSQFKSRISDLELKLDAKIAYDSNRLQSSLKEHQTPLVEQHKFQKEIKIHNSLHSLKNPQWQFDNSPLHHLQNKTKSTRNNLLLFMGITLVGLVAFVQSNSSSASTTTILVKEETRGPARQLQQQQESFVFCPVCLQQSMKLFYQDEQKAVVKAYNAIKNITDNEFILKMIEHSQEKQLNDIQTLERSVNEGFTHIMKNYNDRQVLFTQNESLRYRYRNTSTHFYGYHRNTTKLHRDSKNNQTHSEGFSKIRKRSNQMILGQQLENAIMQNLTNEGFRDNFTILSNMSALKEHLQLGLQICQNIGSWIIRQAKHKLKENIQNNIALFPKESEFRKETYSSNIKSGATAQNTFLMDRFYTSLIYNNPSPYFPVKK